MPFTIDDLNYDKDSKERMPWEHYLELYAKADPKEIASRLSIPYDEEAKEFTLTFLGSEYKITYPDFQVKHVADEKKCYPLEDMIYAKILTIRFLLNGSASVGTGRFKTYREMPWGEVYLRQFDGRCIKRLAFTYGNRLDDFRLVMDHMKCSPVKFGDVGYELSIYPGYQIQMLLWEGDDEFPPSSQILFSADYPYIFPVSGSQPTVDHSENTVFRGCGRTQQERTHRRAQRQSDHSRYQHRNDNGNGKLPVKQTGNPPQKTNRNKYRSQHERGGDQRPGQSPHSFLRSLVGAQTFFFHITPDRFDNYNGIVDHDTYRQNQSQQSK